MEIAVVFAALGIAAGLWAQPAAAQCVGDCTGKGSVTISDLVLGVNIALGKALVSDCESLDANKDMMVSVNELVLAVNNALAGQCTVVTPSVTATSTPPRTNTPTPTATLTNTPAGRFADNGDGTIADQQTGLIWEKKVGLGGGAKAALPHNADNAYSWAGHCSLATDHFCQPNAAAALACAQGVQGNQNGCAECQVGQGTCTVDPQVALTTIWDWVVQLNAGSGFAGHSDWRVPTVEELESLAAYKRSAPPAVDVAFNGSSCGQTCTDLASAVCSCTKPSQYVSASSSAQKPTAAWSVGFYDGQVIDLITIPLIIDKASSFGARAVRGRSATPTPVPRYVDNGDGTITDEQTGLMWEKKITLSGGSPTPGQSPTPGPDFTNPHDAYNGYVWSGQCSGKTTKDCQTTAAAAGVCAAAVEGNAVGCAQCAAGEGTCGLVCPVGLACSATDTVWSWVLALNATNFAGHADWRVPKVQELASLIDYTDGTPPAVNGVFQTTGCVAGCTDVTSAACSCTSSGIYWSGSTYAPFSSINAWIVGFNDGVVEPDVRRQPRYVRAVRGGS